MIPKIIHYCWVGNCPKPKSVLYCIESWRKFCPDYKIIEWNESNYDFSKNEYMRQAYEAKKWGFVPDYARLDIVYQYGGIYLDTDVELVKNIDELLSHKAFMGFEDTGDGEFFVNCGHGFGAEPGNEIIEVMRDLYDSVSFRNNDGSYNLLPSPNYTTKALRKFGLTQENKDQLLENMIIYASDVLCPKNFRTGKMHKTNRTVSIHHFTASWMDEDVRKELLHIQRVKKIWGTKPGEAILLLESVWEKYTISELMRKISEYIFMRFKNKLIYLKECIPYYRGILDAKRSENGMEKPVLLDTSIDGDNCGDQIIMQNCEKQLNGIIDCENVKRIPTHRYPTESERNELINASYKILCGTNILSGKIRNYGLWKLNEDISIYKNTILMGVGFDSECEIYDLYTKRMLKTILAPDAIHSVRDRFSERMLKKMGIKNVVYTGCPTMWELTPDLCKKIPHKKGKNVVCTLTDYNREMKVDQYMLNVLSDSYENVWIWPQGIEDEQYISQLKVNGNVSIIEYGMKSFDDIMQKTELDYVGTRLHAGIHALRHMHRTIVIAVDNRARNIGTDTGLPVIERSEIEDKLKIKIYSEFQTEIKLPVSNINYWKKSSEKLMRKC